MVEDARVDTGAAAYRGFLFSDMRGFTAFAERHGNTAAAAMVGRFLEIARTAIARHDGAEIKTEGDAIHAVFPSASSAVLCGLEIQDGAAELNAQEPDRPLGLGVGVHAGEAVETAEGYIGRAVNIAARLCAAAKPGEVLVSSTVKGITQASIPVGFIPRGRRRLKGISDPILVYAVTRDVNAKPPREVPRPVILGAAGVAVAAVIAVAVVAGAQLLAPPATNPSPTAPPLGQPLVIGPLPLGTYSARAFVPRFTFQIKDPGWTASRDGAEILGLLRDDAPRGSVYFLRVRDVIDIPCVEGGEGAPQTGPGAADLLTELQSLTHLTVSEPETVQVGGFIGRQVRITVSDGVLAACGGLVGGEASLFDAGEVWKVSPGEVFTLISINVSGEAVAILVSTDWTETPSVQELESLHVLGQRILDCVRF
jgi:class 3 adenylate cyclase